MSPQLQGSFEHLQVERDGPVLRVVIDRAAVMNALHPAAHDELARVFDGYHHDDTLRVATLSGRGERAFCTGTDLNALAATGDHHKPASGFAGLTTRFDLDKPVIAVVNGAAIGGGLEIVLACDLAIAVDEARFGFAEPRVGLAAMGGGLHRLVRHIPTKLAMGLILTGHTIDAAEAARLGLVNQVVPRAALAATVQQWIDEILLCAPLAVQASKAVARDSAAHPHLRDAIDATYEAAQRMLASEDAVEGPRAFAAKRTPRWKGR